MAEYSRPNTLGRALSQPTLIETNDVSPPNVQLHPSRRRKLSSCSSVENLDWVTSPCGNESRVLVINTGGTIGMTLHDKGICDGLCSQLLLTLLLSFAVSVWSPRLLQITQHMHRLVCHMLLGTRCKDYSMLPNNWHVDPKIDTWEGTLRIKINRSKNGHFLIYFPPQTKRTYLFAIKLYSFGAVIY